MHNGAKFPGIPAGIFLKTYSGEFLALEGHRGEVRYGGQKTYGLLVLTKPH